MDSTYISMITTDGTLGNVILAIGSSLITAVVAYLLYLFAKEFKLRMELSRDLTVNRMDLDNLYTAYKKGVVIKSAEEENVTLVYRAEKPVKSIADALKEQVKTEISQ